jgi:predicted transcriptional regulator of viral defense system
MTVSNMKPHKSRHHKMMELIKDSFLIRPSDLRRLRIPDVYLTRLVEKGALVRLQRGLYAPTSRREHFAHQSLIEVAVKAPKAIFCLLSALQFHEIGTQLPHEVWIAIGLTDRKPNISNTSIRVVKLSQGPLRFGVGEHLVNGVKLRVYSPAKTVADCFKFRNKIGLDIAIEALRDTLRQKKATTDELWQAAKVCRVSKVMLPYMESIV